MPSILPGPLVTTEWLATRLGAAALRILDASWYLPQQQRDPRQEFLAGHIPGARWLDLDAASRPDTSLPHMLPTAAHAATTFGDLGIGHDTDVVVYDGSGVQMSAPRVWWMLRVFGHERVAVLDGGMVRWRAEGRPLEVGPEAPVAPAPFEARHEPGLVRSAEEVAAALATGTARVVDARSAARFRGEVEEPRAGLRRGHIPGSANLPFTDLVDATTGTYKRREELRATCASLGIDGSRPVITTCGSGVTACSVMLALQVIGVGEVAVYDGSWAEWGGSDRPVAP